MKEEKLVIRLDENLKKAFIATCRSQDTDASKELRKFIRSYVLRYGQKELKI